MRYPLNNWTTLRRGYAFMVPTFYSPHHLGVDYIIPTGTKLYAWDNIEVTKSFTGKEGGNTAWVKYDGKLFRFLHLKQLPKMGNYKEGEVFAITNNTGVSTGAHVHIDISKNGTLELTNYANFIDPDNYFKSLMTTNYTCNNPDIILACKKIGVDVGNNINDGEAKDVLKRAKEVVAIKDTCISKLSDTDIKIRRLEEDLSVNGERLIECNDTITLIMEQHDKERQDFEKKIEELKKEKVVELESATFAQLIKALINKI